MDELFGECGHGAHNLNDNLQCLICGEYSDNLLTKEQFEQQTTT